MIGFNRNSLAHCLEQTMNLKSFPTKTNSPFLRQIPASGVNNGEYTPLCMQPQPNESTYLAKGIEVAGTLRWWRLADRWTGYTERFFGLEKMDELHVESCWISMFGRLLFWGDELNGLQLRPLLIFPAIRCQISSDLNCWGGDSFPLRSLRQVLLLSSWGDCWGAQLCINSMFVGWISR